MARCDLFSKTSGTHYTQQAYSTGVWLKKKSLGKVLEFQEVISLGLLSLLIKTNEKGVALEHRSLDLECLAPLQHVSISLSSLFVHSLPARSHW